MYTSGAGLSDFYQMEHVLEELSRDSDNNSKEHAVSGGEGRSSRDSWGFSTWRGTLSAFSKSFELRVGLEISSLEDITPESWPRELKLVPRNYPAGQSMTEYLQTLGVSVCLVRPPKPETSQMQQFRTFMELLRARNKYVLSTWPSPELNIDQFNLLIYALPNGKLRGAFFKTQSKHDADQRQSLMPRITAFDHDVQQLQNISHTHPDDIARLMCALVVGEPGQENN